MAWADKPESGSKYWRAGYRDSAGKQLYVKDGVGGIVHYRLKTDARRAAHEAEINARLRPPAVAPTTMTWGTWWNRVGFIQETSMSECLRRQWGDVRLQTISNDAVKKWIRGLNATCSVSYVHRIYRVFKGTMEAAMNAELIDATPCLGIKRDCR